MQRLKVHYDCNNKGKYATYSKGLRSFNDLKRLIDDLDGKNFTLFSFKYNDKSIVIGGNSELYIFTLEVLEDNSNFTLKSKSEGENCSIIEMVLGGQLSGFERRKLVSKNYLIEVLDNLLQKNVNVLDKFDWIEE